MSWWCLFDELGQDEKVSMSAGQILAQARRVVRERSAADAVVDRPNFDVFDCLIDCVGRDAVSFRDESSAYLKFFPEQNSLVSEFLLPDWPAEVQREKPVKFEVPTLGQKTVSFEMVLSFRPHHMPPSLEASTGQVLRIAEDRPSEDRIVLKVEASSDEDHLVLSLRGHRLQLLEISLLLTGASNCESLSDPLATYDDPLGRYGIFKQKFL